MRKMTMLDYVGEATAVARANIARRDELVAPLIELCGGSVPRRLLLVASGSSLNACRCAEPFMASCLGDACRVELMTPFAFTYYTPSVGPDDLVLVVTQSGLSTNALEALDCMRSQGLRAVCLTGNVDSDARDHADIVVDYGVGEELVGYVTKGVTTLATFLMLLAARLSGKDERIADVDVALDAADAVREATRSFFECHEKAFTSMRVCYCCGAGPTMGVAAEGALKLGETVHIPAASYEVEEYIHGPNLQLTPAYTVLFFDPGDTASERVQRIWRATREVTDSAFILTPEQGLADDDRALVLPHIAPDTASLAQLPFIQLLSFFASSALGGTKQHPLMRRFKAVASAKTEHFVNYDEDD